MLRGFNFPEDEVNVFTFTAICENFSKFIIDNNIWNDKYYILPKNNIFNKTEIKKLRTKYVL